MKPQPKPVRQSDAKYLSWIKGCVCFVCQRPGPSDPHHINEVGHGGKGTKTDDHRTLPLCHEHHREYHDKGRETFAKMYRLDYEATIAAYRRVWANNNN